MTKDPWFKWYPADWRADPGLRMCSFAARGLWIDLIGLMHEAAPYGHLVVNGKIPTPRQLASLLGGTPKEVETLLDELEAAGVFSRTDDGSIYSRRMLRDRERAEAGRYWVSKRRDRGEPKPEPSGIPSSPPTRGASGEASTQKPEARSQKPEEESSSADSELVAACESEPRIRSTTLAGQIVERFDYALRRHFPDRARAWPHPKDAIHAQRWLDAGAQPDLVASVIEARLVAMAGAAQEPPKTLSYFERPVLEALELAKRPVDDPLEIPGFLRRQPQPRHGTDAFLAAAASLMGEPPVARHAEPAPAPARGAAEPGGAAGSDPGGGVVVDVVPEAEAAGAAEPAPAALPHAGHG